MSKKTRRRSSGTPGKAPRKLPAARTPPTPVAAGAGLDVPARGVRIRMYRQGFGDCFLVSFGREEKPPYHMLIDCGLLPRAPSVERMRAVVAQIKADTGGALDALVCTHEHADHLSGFLHAADVWREIAVRELWLAWTEDPADKVAARLRDGRAARLAGLRELQPRLRALGACDGGIVSAAADQVDAALAFLGAAASPNDTARALEFVHTLAAKKPRYFRPGDLVIQAPLPGVRMFVLGPPRDEAMLGKDKPTSGHSEVYHLGASRAADQAFFAAATGMAGADGCPTPFEEPFSIPVKAVEAADAEGDSDAEVIHARYYASSSEETDETVVGGRVVSVSAWESDQSWRRIDSDWLAEAGEMALKLDEDTNNTSLVLAIELVESGRVLLFPGDAQVGNWLSWDDCRWTVPGDSGQDRVVTAADLLARTVLYKVGHHASHNATLKEKGLERMVSDDLVAMIPVDEAVAKKQGVKGWNMPYPPLYERLREKTVGRVLRADAGMPGRPSGVPAAGWKAFTRRAAVTDLFTDFVVDSAAD